MKLYIERTGETVTKQFSGRASKLLEELDILVDEVLVIRNGRLVAEDEELTDEDEVRLLSVISGG